MQASLKHLKAKGFTIVELLIVIVVIGILAAISIIAYNGVQKQAVDKAVLSDIDGVASAETRYSLKNGGTAKAWYSGNGVDTNLSFPASPGNVIDVVITATDYCIRSYNPNAATYNTLQTAAKQESSSGVCGSISPSSSAIAANSPPPFVNNSNVSTLAGSTAGNVNAQGTSAKLNFPTNVFVDAAGTVFVADTNNHVIKKITASGVVSTLAGSSVRGYADGTGTAAQFSYPTDVTVDTSGNAYVTDDGRMIRKITPGGVVTTLAGTTGPGGYVDGQGTAARFNGAYALVVNSAGTTIYVADQSNNMIRAVSTSGSVITLAGSTSGGYVDGIGTAAQFSSPSDIAIDSWGTLYVADQGNHMIRKVTTGGSVSTFAGSGVNGYADGTGTAAQFSYPEGVAVDSSGTVYTSDGSQRIRKITSGGVVSTLAGATGLIGTTNGNPSRFNYPMGLAVDTSGVVYVADQANNRIRKIQ